MALLQYNFTVDVIVYFETKILMIDLKSTILARMFIIDIDNHDYMHKKCCESKHCLCHDIFLHDT